VVRERVTEITGDSFSIELIGGAYNGYTQAGYIEAGNVHVESTTQRSEAAPSADGRAEADHRLGHG
jgi:hypothetical protein